MTHQLKDLARLAGSQVVAFESVHPTIVQQVDPSIPISICSRIKQKVLSGIGIKRSLIVLKI